MYDTHSNEIKDLCAALSKAQSQMLPALKDSANPYFKSHYADLSSVWQVCRPVLAENGLCIIQTVVPYHPTGEEKPKYNTILVTTLAHSSGQYMKSFNPIICQKEDVQSYGAALTYFRRYALAAIMGVSQEDSDGEGAMKRESPNDKKVTFERDQMAIKEFQDSLDKDYQIYFKPYIDQLCKSSKASAVELIDRINQDISKFYIHFNGWIEKNINKFQSED